MRKILKLLSIVVVSFCVLILIGCANSKVTYKDPETGEEKEIHIEKTDSDQEVTDSLYAIALSDTPLKSSNKETITINFNVELKTRDDGEEDFKDFNLEGKLTTSHEIIYNEVFVSSYDIIEMIDASGKLELKGKVPTSSGSESISKSTIELYFDEGILYLKSDLDNKLITFINDNDKDVGSTLETLNNKLYKYYPKNYISNKELTREEKEAISDLLNNGSKDSLRSLLNNLNIDLNDIRAELEEAVRNYNIKISRVSGSNVTYNFDLSNLLKDDKRKIEASVTIDVSEMALTSAKVKVIFDTDNLKGEISLDLECSFKANVEKLSDAEKEEALDYEETWED